jgi:hypothetical protein
MALTPANSVPYAGPNDAPDVPYWQQRQAEFIDADKTSKDGRLTAVEKAGLGQIYWNVGTANSGAFSTASVVANIASFTFKAGRRYRIVWDFSYNTSTAGTYMSMCIARCSTTDAAALTTGLTNLGGRTIHTDGAGLTESRTIYGYYNPTTDSTVQIKFYGARTAGTGTMTILSASEPAYYYIEDLGAQL